MTDGSGGGGRRGRAARAGGRRAGRRPPGGAARGGGARPRSRPNGRVAAVHRRRPAERRRPRRPRVPGVRVRPPDRARRRPGVPARRAAARAAPRRRRADAAPLPRSTPGRGSRQLVAELDDALTGLVRERLPLPAGHRIRVRAADARAVAESVRPASYDLVIADVFAGAVTPAHLTTAEFAAATARALRPGGVYAVNVAAGPSPRAAPRPGSRRPRGSTRRGRRWPPSVRYTRRRA